MAPPPPSQRSYSLDFDDVELADTSNGESKSEAGELEWALNRRGRVMKAASARSGQASPSPGSEAGAMTPSFTSPQAPCLEVSIAIDRGGVAARSRPRPQKPGLTIVRSNRCHSFKWSRELWAAAARKIRMWMIFLLAVYIVLEGWLSYRDGLRGVDIPYYIIATVTTVGLGDLSPSSQLHRATHIFMLPFGLVVVSFGISLASALARANAPSLGGGESDGEDDDDEDDEDLSDGEGGEEPAASSALAREARALARKYALVVCLGAAFFLLHPGERAAQKEALGQPLTPVDALYFSTVLATTVGYGHELVARTAAAKWFCCAFMLWACTAVGGIIGALSSSSLARHEGEITDELIESTTWVHRADLDGDGVVTEADYGEVAVEPTTVRLSGAAPLPALSLS